MDDNSIDLGFESPAELRALRDVSGSTDAQEPCIHEFVATWTTVMYADRLAFLTDHKGGKAGSQDVSMSSGSYRGRISCHLNRSMIAVWMKLVGGAFPGTLGLPASCLPHVGITPYLVTVTILVGGLSGVSAFGIGDRGKS